MQELFNKKTIKRLCAVDLTNDQIECSKKWLEMLDAGKLKKEKPNILIFADIILYGILGYPKDDIKYEEDKVEFQYPKKKKSVICFEAKGTDTKDLFGLQHREKKEHSTPIKQTWDYMGNSNLDYGVVTNYRHFVLITKKFALLKFHFFDFMKIQNDPNKLKEFIGVFSRASIESNFIEKLADESVMEEKAFTNEFYKLYHETRLMMIKALQNDRVDRIKAIYITQIFMNRLIFMFFAADKGLIPNRRMFTDRIRNLVDSLEPTDNSHAIYNEIQTQFKAFAEGDKKLNIFEFNGCLFNWEIPSYIFFKDIQKMNFYKDVCPNGRSQLNLDEKTAKAVKKHDDLNPIIINLLLLDSHDFDSEVSINILGHIFEQSISDLDDIQKTKTLQRKKDGVFYTSHYLTDYICKNTIIPHLSKDGCATNADELVDEYKENIVELEEKMNQIKILDPACGSGAFLVNAVEVLLEIYGVIQIYKYEGDTQQQLTKWSYMDQAKKVIDNNIFGVDVNSESVEITKLSLFFMTARENVPLPDLQKNIKVGNSLIDPNDCVKYTRRKKIDENTISEKISHKGEDVDPRAFDWEGNFGEIFKNGGFDIIIGNPPWQILKPDVDEFFGPLYDEKHPGRKFSKLKKNEKNQFVEEQCKILQVKRDWEKYLDGYEIQMGYFNNSDLYKYQTSVVKDKKISSDINLYKLFMEKSYHLLVNGGRCGLVVPSGIYTDLGSKGLRELFFNENELMHIFSFTNPKKIFEDVHRQFKFCIFIYKKGGSTDKFRACFYRENILDLIDHKKITYEYGVDIIKKRSPESLAILEYKDNTEFKIMSKLYRNPLLGSNEWDFNATSEFHMTNNSDLFHTTNVGNPLFEGKMINMFTHTFAPPKYWIECDGSELLIKKEKKRIKSTLSKIMKEKAYKEVNLIEKTDGVKKSILKAMKKKANNELKEMKEAAEKSQSPPPVLILMNIDWSGEQLQTPPMKGL